MQSTDILMAEHRLIEQVLDCLEKIVQQVTTGQKLDRESSLEAIDFCRAFVDGCHHAKEEGYLFPLLVQRGLSQEEGPIAVMLSEHNQGRAHVRAIFEELEKGAPDRLAVAAHLEAFVALLRAHIGKEDNVLFPMADQLLTTQDQVTLEADFERVEREEIGEGVHEQYHQLAHELTAA